MADEKRTDGGEGFDWLEALEERVRAATGRLKELAGENEKLAAENEKLAKKAKDLEARLAKAADESGEEGWVKEREEIRGRVERLTETLEGLLDGE